MNLINALVGVATFFATILFNSIIEWFVHGPMMHGFLSKTLHMHNSHVGHHDHYRGRDFQNNNHGDSVALPWWSAIVIIGCLIYLGIQAANLVGYQIVGWIVGTVSIVYYFFYQYVHTLMHVESAAKNSWFAKTSFFKKLRAYHLVHHVKDSDFSRFVNLCIVCNWADILLGTKYTERKHISRTTVVISVIFLVIVSPLIAIQHWRVGHGRRFLVCFLLGFMGAISLLAHLVTLHSNGYTITGSILVYLCCYYFTNRLIANRIGLETT
jgi:hypothetical protein